MKSPTLVCAAPLGRVSCFVLALLFSPIASHAQLIVFDFTGTNPGQNSPWTTTSTLVSGLTLTTGWSLGTVTGAAANNRFSISNWSTGTTFSAASTGNDFVTFSITAAPGNQLNLSGATINFSLQNSSTGPDFYSVRSSVDGFGSNLSASSTALTTTGGTTTTSLALPSSVAYTALTNTVEFRLYGWGATSGGGTMSVNSWSMTGGLSAVPEPSTYAAIFGGIALVGAVIQRRRAHRAAGQSGP